MRKKKTSTDVSHPFLKFGLISLKKFSSKHSILIPRGSAIIHPRVGGVGVGVRRRFLGGLHGFLVERSGDQSSPTEYKGGP